ncbi:MAG: preprotein translocase subunit SecA [Phycisphaerales bacterium]|jgi:preprotein translocase subunit SecA
MAGNSDIPVIGPILNKFFGTRNERVVKRYTQRVDEIGEFEPQMLKLTADELRAKTEEFRVRFDEGVKPDDLLCEVFAVAREVMDREVGIRNIFNPEHGFDASALSGKARELFDKAAAEIATLESADPDGRWLGHPHSIEPWRQVDLHPDLCAAVRELYPESRPPFRARPFDVQLIGGMVLGQGRIAEMKTGEGKTIVAPLATYMASVQRQQVHVVTVNDYLVQRDRDWTFPFFAGVGLTVGAIHPSHQQPEEQKRNMYRCDVVYGTTSEFGFDYLRDNMKRSVDQQVQRKRQFAIVDEVDSTLIDEARTPLIISGPAHDDAPRYDEADRFARHLVDRQSPWQDHEDSVQRCKETIKGLEGDIRQLRDASEKPALQAKLEEARESLPKFENERDAFVQYYELEMDRKRANLTHEGIAEAQRVAGVGSFYVDENMDLPHLLEQSLRAHAVYQLDRDYIVMDVPDRMTGRSEPNVVIVDTNTGRPMIGRQWSDGLHQAVECKEGVPIKPETQTVASVTIQNFFKMYKRLSGMTGTADTEAQEFHDIYKLDVVSIPTNKPIVRGDYDDLMFLREKDKWDGIVDEIKRFHDIGRPILVGTTSVEKSELLGTMLSRVHGISHNLLNAKQHEREANIVEDAGQLGAVMIATNMAGRGTDIKLGSFTRAKLVEHWLKRGIAGRGLTPEATEDELRENVFRKIASTELKDEGVKKKEAGELPFEELELRLLRHWAREHTWLSDSKIDSAGRDALLEELDKSGRISIHRVRWFDNVEQIGGLHVIGTERHESRRIDNQLRGRSGRQGDNGSSRFYVSLEDDLMKMFAGETTMKLLSKMGMKEGDAIEHPWLSKNVERAQKKVEERNFQVRKNILEYDEVMEHQRQRFYGLRQRVLEGRDVKGLLFEYIEDAVDDSVHELLDSEYPAMCAAEFTREKLDVSVPAERLRGKDQTDMQAAIRRIAIEEARHNIDITLGEYLPTEGSEISIDFDSAGLHRWAKNHYGIELETGELREGGSTARRDVQQMLEEAARERIENADLTGIEAYTVRDYGLAELTKWVKRKFDFDVTVDELKAARDAEESEVSDPILTKARELYRKREIEYPVDYEMQVTMLVARQDPTQAFERLGRWAHQRFAVDLDAEQIKATQPSKVRDNLIEYSEKFVDEGMLGAAIDEALGKATDAELDAWMNERFGVGVTDRMKFLDEDDRPDAVRARIESVLRAELLQLEQAILIDTFDTSWKDHLYSMDQMRDLIGFRAFSQQDPRIEYKREGQRAFLTMMEGVREKVTDLVFRARMQPGNPQGQRPPAPRPAPAPTAAANRAMSAGMPMGGMINGPGLGGFGGVSGPGLPQRRPQAPPQAPPQGGPQTSPNPNKPAE